jgi:hypothetical protein
MKRYVATSILCFAAALSSACGGDDSDKDAVKSTADAERAYLGLDASIDRAIALGFDGFNAASSANIAPVTASGDAAGSMTVGGQVDQGASSNKTMRLTEALAGYADDPKLVYDTDTAALPALDMKLSMVPNGTLTGTLVGTFAISGDLQGSVALNLSFTGDLEPDPNDPTHVERKPGTTHITGTATSGSDTYTVDVTH